ADAAQPLACRPSRKAVVAGAGRHVADHAGAGADHGAIADGDVVGNAGLSGHHHIIPDFDTARYADLRDNDAVSPDLAVVSDLHQIVDLGALADDGVAAGAAVDGRIGADLHIVLNDDAAGLRDFLMALRARQIAKTVLADTGARVDDDAIADQRMLDRRAGADRAIAADADARADHRT